VQHEIAKHDQDMLYRCGQGGDGLPVRPAHNRIGRERKVRTPGWLKPFIRQAIMELTSTNNKTTYKEIQKRAFEIYMKSNQRSKVEQSKGMLSGKPKEVQDFINDKEIFYAF